MKGKNCPEAEVKIVNGKEQIFCRFSLMAFKKMQLCVGEDCTLDDEILGWDEEDPDEEPE